MNFDMRGDFNMNENTILRTVPAASELHKVPGFDPMKHQCTIKKANPYFVFINGLFGCVFIRDRENEK